MATIRQMTSGFFRNYRTQYSNGQIFRNTPKNNTWQAAQKVNNLNTQQSTTKNNDVRAAMKELMNYYSGGRFAPNPYDLIGSQLNAMYNGGASLNLNNLGGLISLLT